MIGIDFGRPQSLRGVFERAGCCFCCEALAPAALCEVEADLKAQLAGCIGPRSPLPWSNSAQHRTQWDPRSISALRLGVRRAGWGQPISAITAGPPHDSIAKGRFSARILQLLPRRARTAIDGCVIQLKRRRATETTDRARQFGAARRRKASGSVRRSTAVICLSVNLVASSSVPFRWSGSDKSGGVSEVQLTRALT
jgi:hypothetical protein